MKAGQCENSFSMCLGYNGGILVLGGVNDSYSAGPMVYTGIIEETYYNVKFNDVTINGAPLGITAQIRTILDSGTTFLILSKEFFGPVISQLIQLCPPELKSICTLTALFQAGNCANIQLSSVLKFPKIGFKFDNISTPLEISPTDYFLEVKNNYCFGISMTENINILGDVFMQKFNILFDRTNKQIGIAPVSNCETGSTLIEISSGNEQSVSQGFTSDNPITVRGWSFLKKQFISHL